MKRNYSPKISFQVEQDRRFESVYSKKVRAGRRRTYFFDVRRTRGDDFYLTLTESTKRINGHGYERHKIFLYKEDFNRFISNLEEVIQHIKTELMPDYDYEEFDRRELEWEARRAEGGYYDDHHEEGNDENRTANRGENPRRNQRETPVENPGENLDQEVDEDVNEEVDEEIEEELPPPPPHRQPEPPAAPRKEKHPDVDDDLSW